MKKAAKVFIVLGMLFQFWMVLPLIVGAIALGKMKKAKPSVGMGICLILFVNPLAGIFTLCSRESEYPAGQVAAMPAPTYSAPAPTYAAPAPTPAYSAPDAYSAPAKEKSFDSKDDEPAKGGSSSTEDDLAAQMQRMFDSQN